LRGEFAPLPADVPEDLAALVTGLLRPERQDREPQTATEALALLRRHGQPVASAAELAALVLARKAQRGAGPERVHRAPLLAPGEMLEPGDLLVPRVAAKPEALPGAEIAQPPAPAPPLPEQVPAPEQTPAAAAPLAPEQAPAAAAPLAPEQAPAAAAPLAPEPAPTVAPPLAAEPTLHEPVPVFPLPAEPALPPLPQPRLRVTTTLAGASEPEPGPRPSGPARVAIAARPRRKAVYRAVGAMLLLVCVFVSGILFHARIQRLRGERDAGDMQHPDVPAPVVVPAPVPPVPLVLKPAEVVEEDPITRPRHGRKKQRVGGLRPVRAGTQQQARRPAPGELRWEPVPRLGSEPPRWGTP
jgi:hypothetical protein